MKIKAEKKHKPINIKEQEETVLKMVSAKEAQEQKGLFGEVQSRTHAQEHTKVTQMKETQCLSKDIFNHREYSYNKAILQSEAK